MAYKGFKYRIYPNDEQKVLINKTIGCCRVIYNCLLVDCKNQYKETGKSKVGSYKLVKDKFEWMKEVDSTALNYAKRSLDFAYHNHFKNPQFFGLPTFKKKHNDGSFTSQNDTNARSIYIKNGIIRLPKLGKIRIVLHRKYEGRIVSATVSKTCSGKYYVSVKCEINDKPKQKITQEKVLGIDMSFKEMGIMSDEKKTNFQNTYILNERKLKHLKRNFSRTIVGSKNHEKMRIKVAKLEEKMANQRRDFNNKLSTEIVKNYNVVVIEDINLQSMGKKRKNENGTKRKLFGKRIREICFGQFKTMLEYKLNENGGILVVADKYYPSTQLCSNCGYKNTNLKGFKNLNIREWDCPNCGVHHDRDLNASKNLVNYYFNNYKCTDATTGNKACGEIVGVDELDFKETIFSMKHEKKNEIILA